MAQEPQTMQEQVDGLLELTGHALISAVKKLDFPEAQEARVSLSVIIPDKEEDANRVYTRANVDGDKMESLILTLVDLLVEQTEGDFTSAELFAEWAKNAESQKDKVERIKLEHDNAKS